MIAPKATRFQIPRVIYKELWTFTEELEIFKK